MLRVLLITVTCCVYFGGMAGLFCYLARQVRDRGGGDDGDDPGGVMAGRCQPRVAWPAGVS